MDGWALSAFGLISHHHRCRVAAKGRGRTGGARSPAVGSVPEPLSGGGGAWSSGKNRNALVYQGRGLGSRARAPTPTSTPPAASPTPTPVSTPTPQPSQSPHSSIITLTTSSILTSSGVISNAVRGAAPRAPTPTPISTTAAPRPLPLLQRSYQPTKVVSVANVGVRGVVGNSAPSQLYYEVPLGSQQHVAHHQQQQHAPQLLHQVQQLPRPLTPYNHNQAAVQVSVVNSGQSVNEARQLATSLAASTILPRPSILRKRDIDGSPSKVGSYLSGGGTIGLSIYREVNSVVGSVGGGAPGWEDVPAGGRGPGSGSTTMSAASSPPHDDTEHAQPALAPAPTHTPDLSPRKKPRKQMLSNEVRQCELTTEDALPTPPPPANPPKRPQLGSGYVCGWRGTALHFVRPADVRRREPRARDILAIASQRHVLASADGWKVHHLTAQMDDLVSLEADVGSQLAGVLRALETASGRALAALQPHEHALLELLKGNIQRSKIVCEGIQEAREDILRVFKHRNFVSDILTRQADKRCYRKHRSQS